MTLPSRLIRRSCAAALLAAVLFGLATLFSDRLTALPVSWRFVLAVLAMAFAPGYCILQFTRAWRPDALTNLALAFVLSLSVNLLLNVALMLSGGALVTALVPYMMATGAGLVFGMRRAEREDDRGFMTPTWLDGALVVGIVTLLALIYRVGPPNIAAEELVVINRLATNAGIHYNNVSFQQGMPATYLLVPTQQLFAAVALMSGLEPAIVQPLFWMVTAGVGIAALAALVAACAGTAVAVPLTIGLLIAIGIFEPEALTFQFGFGIPFPNRYGMAPGVLLPLILLFFWQQLQAGSLRGVQLFVLVYLILEITFVHAREAISALSCIIVIGALSIQRGRVRTTLVVTGGTVLISLAALLIYRSLTLTFSTDLNAYVQDMRTVIWSTFRDYGREKTLAGMLSLPAPSIHVGPTLVEVPTYEDIVEKIWVPDPGLYTSRILFPLTFLALPLAMAWARTRLHLAMGGVVAVWGLLLHSGGLVLLVSYVIGNPEALNVTSLIGLMLFCCAMALLASAAEGLHRLGAGRWIRLATFAGLAIAVTSLLAMRRLDVYQPLALWLTTVLIPPAPTVLHVLTLMAIAWKMWHFSRQRPGQPANVAGRGRSLAVAAVALAVTMPIGIRAWSRRIDLVRRPVSLGQVAGRSADDYALLRRERRIACSLPFELIVYLRSAKPAQNVIAQDSHCVALLTPHYVVTNGTSGHALSSTSIVNARFAQLFPETAGRDPGAPQAPMYTLDAFDNRDQWLRLVSSMNVNLVIVEPKEQEAAMRLLASFSPGDPATPSLVWSEGGYGVLKSRR